MSTTIIQSAFNKALKTALPTLTIKVENQAIDSGLSVYAVTHLLPVPTAQAALGENARNMHKGIFQVTIKTKKGIGWGNGAEIADSIMAAFQRGTVLTQSTHTITVERSYIGPGFYDEDNYCLPVSIDYYCFLSKNE